MLVMLVVLVMLAVELVAFLIKSVVLLPITSIVEF